MSAADWVETFGVVALAPDYYGVFIDCSCRERRGFDIENLSFVYPFCGVGLGLLTVIELTFCEGLLLTVFVNHYTNRFINRL